MEMSERQQQFSGTGAVRDGQEIDKARLTEWMAANVADFAGPLVIEQFKGGQSNPTYKLVTPGQNYVLRRKPPGQLLPSAHAVDREYKVITALHGVGFPAPRTFGLCTDNDVIGTWFYVMEFIPGRVIWDIYGEAHSNTERRAIFESALDALGKLHRVDYQSVGLGDYGKPGNYFERQLKRWISQYEYTRSAQPNPGLDALIEWIPNNIPKDDRTTIVHGDPQISNMMFHAEQPKVLALLDWELSTLGHPMVDLSYLCHTFYTEAPSGLAGRTPESIGLPSVEEILTRYGELTGTPKTSRQDWL
ncbi:phosphotransferase family protein, partial [Sandarakinorhabdus sp.]|uniref:phosphotransferase family protein n=1 Tax=Sandarakinorhabdus sp. TaxID=1916663 RepID=UPI00286DB52C